MTTPPVPPPPGSNPPPADPPQGGYQAPAPAGYQAPPPAGHRLKPGVVYPYWAVPALPKDAYTSWLRRVAAFVIDFVPVFVLLLAGEALTLITAVKNDCITERSEQNYGVSCTSQPSGLGLVLLATLSLAALAFGIWNYGYRQGKSGSSVGKSIMKFKVVDETTGQPIGFGMSLLRQLAHTVDGMICYIGYLFPLWDAKRQTLADKLMSTVCLPTD